LLCSGRGAEYMLKLTQLLQKGGAILLLSLHEDNFIRPLFEGSGLPLNIEKTRPVPWGRSESKNNVRIGNGTASGNVCSAFLLRRTSDSALPNEDLLSSVALHFLRAQDNWFKVVSPLLTKERELQLRVAFGSKPQPLSKCYELLFTDAEREMLSFVDFMEDFDRFREDKADVGKDRMNIEQALEFLRVMQ